MTPAMACEIDTWETGVARIASEIHATELAGLFPLALRAGIRFHLLETRGDGE
jgi:hypothetical protein